MGLKNVEGTLLIGLGLAVLAFLIWPKSIARGAAKTAIDFASGVAEGTIVGIGEAIGVPATDPQKCAKARESGTLWDVSLYCPMKSYLAEVSKRASGVVKGDRSISWF